MAPKVLNSDGEWVDPGDPSTTGRHVFQRRTALAAILLLCLLPLLWFAILAADYVPADEATCNRIRKGMTSKEVQAIFRRRPFLDTSREDSRGWHLLLGDAETQMWDGPEGAISVIFDGKGVVVRTAFLRPRKEPTVFQWVRARIGLWP